MSSLIEDCISFTATTSRSLISQKPATIFHILITSHPTRKIFNSSFDGRKQTLNSASMQRYEKSSFPLYTETNTHAYLSCRLAFNYWKFQPVRSTEAYQHSYPDTDYCCCFRCHAVQPVIDLQDNETSNVI